MTLISDDAPEWYISQIQIDNTNQNALPADLMASISTRGQLYFYNSTVTNAGDIYLANICLSRVTTSGLSVSPSIMQLSAKALNAYNRMRPNGDYQTDWAKEVLDSYNASAEAILEGTAISSSTTAGGAISSVTFNDSAVATGTTITEYGTLAIMGTNLTQQTIEVKMGDTLWQQILNTDTKLTYNVTSNGTLTVTLNGKLVMTLTVNVVTPRPFTRIDFNNEWTECNPLDGVLDVGVGQVLKVTGTGLTGMKFASNNTNFTITNGNVTDTIAQCTITANVEAQDAVISLGDWVVAQLQSLIPDIEVGE